MFTIPTYHWGIGPLGQNEKALENMALARKLTKPSAQRMTRQEFRQIRNHLKLTQRELANLLGLSLRQISNLESGVYPLTNRDVLSMRLLCRSGVEYARQQLV